MCVSSRFKSLRVISFCCNFLAFASLDMTTRTCVNLIDLIDEMINCLPKRITGMMLIYYEPNVSL